MNNELQVVTTKEIITTNNTKEEYIIFEGITGGLLKFDSSSNPNRYIEVPCAVVKNGDSIIRLITAKGLFTAFGRNSHGAQRVPGFPPVVGSKTIAECIPEDEVKLFKPINYIIDGNSKVGYNAELLITLIKAYMIAEKEGILKKQQQKALDQAKAMLLGLAGQKIRDLIDQATGFYFDEEINAVEKFITKMYTYNDALPTVTKMFPGAYYEALYKLYDWKPNVNNRSYRPRYAAAFTSRFVYGLLPDVVMKVIKERNPIERERRKNKYYHYLTTDTGIPELDKIINKIIVVMQLSTKENFIENYNKTFAQELNNKNIRPLQIKAINNIKQLEESN